jgi:hypothetical protein
MNNKYYDYLYALERMPSNELYYERVHILSKLDRHNAALQIIGQELGDWDKAEEYCNKHYNDSNALLYDSLFTLYKKTNQSLPKIITFLNKYGQYTQTHSPLSYLPSDLKLTDLTQFLTKSLKTQSLKRTNLSVVENIWVCRNLNEKGRLQGLASEKIIVTEDSICYICLKRISSIVFTVLPSNAVAHTYCSNRNIV